MASIRELPSGRFNVQVRRKGTEPTSCTFDTRQDAEDWVRQYESDPQNLQSNENDDPPISFWRLGRQYCDTVLKDRPSRWITLYRIERISDHLPDNAKEITKFDVNRYRLVRLQTVAPVTCRDELQLIHRIFRWAHRELLLDRDSHPSPCADISMPPPSKPRTRVIEAKELELLLSALSPTMRLIVELAYETAMRRSEIVNLRAKHIHLEQRLLSVVDGKEGDRSVPLSTRAVEILRTAMSECQSSESRLFQIGAHSVTQAVRRARRIAGLDDGVRLHQLRHTRCTIVARKGFNQAQIMAVTGHKDIRSVQRYTHLNAADVVKLLD